MFRNFIILLAATMAMTGCVGNGEGKAEKGEAGGEDYVLGAMQAYMERFPESQLRDVYKFCFQDFFGPEHLVSDSAKVAQNIISEIEEADSNDWNYPLFMYPLGLEGNFVRVDLNYVRKRIIDVGSLASAFVKSSEGWLNRENRSLEEWKRQWDEIQSVLRKVNPLPKNFEEDSAMIANALAEGRYAVHHSRLYNETYHQHYRIVRKDLSQMMIGN